MSELRYDPILGEYALIAPERLRRPDCYEERRNHKRKKRRACPFCEGKESLTPPEIFALRDNEPDTPGWKTRVVPNLYKAVKIEEPCRKSEEGIYTKWQGFGAHEVIIDTPRHLLRMDEWSFEEYFNWLFTMRARLNDLKNDLRLVHISLFKNHGHYAASTQPHPHTQLIALPDTPARELGQIRSEHRYFKEHGCSVYETVIRAEQKEKSRIVSESESFIALCPYASAFAFETVIYAKKAVSDLGRFDDEALKELAGILKKTVSALYLQLGDFDFNITLNTPPLQKNFTTEAFFDDIPQIRRFGLRIVPRLFRLGGFELGSGIPINPLMPEEAASLLRESRE